MKMKHRSIQAVRLLLVVIFLLTIFASGGATYANNTHGSAKLQVGLYDIYLPILQKIPPPFTGHVTYMGAPAANKRIDMYYTTNNWVNYSLYSYTQTNSSGDFMFTNLPEVGGTKKYSVQWENPDNNYTAPYLAAWVCDDVVGLATDKLNCNFDIQDVVLSSPVHDAAVNLPYTFRWYPRTTTSDMYEVNWWDPDLGHYMWTNPPLPYTSSYTLTSIPSSFLTWFPYNWTVYPIGPNGNGIPYWYRWVTFMDRSSPPLEGVSPTNELIHENGASGSLPLRFLLRSDTIQPRPAVEGEKPR